MLAAGWLRGRRVAVRRSRAANNRGPHPSLTKGGDHCTPPLHHVTAKREDWLASSAAEAVAVEVAVPTTSVEAAVIVAIAIAVSEAAVVEAPVRK